MTCPKATLQREKFFAIYECLRRGEEPPDDPEEESDELHLAECKDCQAAELEILQELWDIIDRDIIADQIRKAKRR